ncbi:unnamed protein product (macronuclear) [Paramecium tetraurelia]|uniref:Uncharacterized protein n=1 Tax=Paramecium tetraurelia TaxID=5888 RepID=A0CV83_PARTE|nr:uncharacterized protein GSPATT00010868001 [Paramecium tetraurelia]CAK74700.1 unnamed protein product [Paramecium tetraurelia]|eukprot:XP_001442097.1 hypothetical protein (macronuclear) [Paramecium tetraurelia strain d4-2]
MNNLHIKQEDQQALRNIQIPKQISMFPSQQYFSQYYSPTMIYFHQEHMIIQKFLKALHNLQVAQGQLHNSPKYPFVIQVSNNQILVHLGRIQLDISNKFGHIFSPQSYYVPQYAQVISQYPKLKLHIQKKRQVRLMQDQKDTKNIPKNYCKSIITFACKNQQNLCIRILKDQVKVVKFINKISQYKKQLLNIRVFSALLQRSEDPEEEEYRLAFRIISQIFIKKQAINYIFNSKIAQHNWHMKYRQKIYKGIKDPNRFSHIKNL